MSMVFRLDSIEVWMRIERIMSFSILRLARKDGLKYIQKSCKQPYLHHQTLPLYMQSQSIQKMKITRSFYTSQPGIMSHMIAQKHQSVQSHPGFPCHTQRLLIYIMFVLLTFPFHSACHSYSVPFPVEQPSSELAAAVLSPVHSFASWFAYVLLPLHDSVVAIVE